MQHPARSLPQDKPTLDPDCPDVAVITEMDEFFKPVKHAVRLKHVKRIALICRHHDSIKLLASLKAAQLFLRIANLLSTRLHIFPRH